MEVVDRATPVSRLAWEFQPSAQWATAAHPRNGAVKPTRPTTVTSVSLVRMTAGSSSAPARKVSSTAPVVGAQAAKPAEMRGDGRHGHAHADLDEGDGDAQTIGDDGRHDRQGQPDGGDREELLHGGVLLV